MELNFTETGLNVLLLADYPSFASHGLQKLRKKSINLSSATIG